MSTSASAMLELNTASGVRQGAAVRRGPAPPQVNDFAAALKETTARSTEMITRDTRSAELSTREARSTEMVARDARNKELSVREARSTEMLARDRAETKQISSEKIAPWQDRRNKLPQDDNLLKADKRPDSSTEGRPFRKDRSDETVKRTPENQDNDNVSESNGGVNEAEESNTRSSEGGLTQDSGTQTRKESDGNGLLQNGAPAPLVVTSAQVQLQTLNTPIAVSAASALSNADIATSTVLTSAAKASLITASGKAASTDGAKPNDSTDAASATLADQITGADAVETALASAIKALPGNKPYTAETSATKTDASANEASKAAQGAEAPSGALQATPKPLETQKFDLASLNAATASAQNDPSAATAAASGVGFTREAAQNSAPAMTAPLARADQPVPLQALAVEVGMRAMRGSKEFQIKLDPEDLGRIDIKLEIDEAGTVQAKLVVERPETLQMLQRDAKTLERAFDQAGLKTNPDGLQFSLKSDSQSGGQQGNQDGHSKSSRMTVEASPEAFETRTLAYRIPAAGALDISI